MANKAALESVKATLAKVVQSGGFGRHLNRVNILEAGNGKVTASMKVEPDHCNAYGSLHGAFSTLIVDNMSGLGLLTYPNVSTAGVSIHLNMTFSRAATVGEEILIKSTADKVGKQLAFLTVEILKKESGELIARGNHTKFIGTGKQGGEGSSRKTKSDASS